MPEARPEETTTAKTEEAKTPEAPSATNEFTEAAATDAGKTAPKVVKKTALLKNTEDFIKDLGVTKAQIVSLEEKTTQTASSKNQYVVLSMDGGEEAVKNFLLKAALATKTGYEKLAFELLDDTAEGDEQKEYVFVFHTDATLAA